MPRLTEALGGKVELFIKRDDVMGLGGGGNKVRKLEFVVGEALAQGADTLYTAGAVQSNHCRLTAAAAAKEGLACRLVLQERVPGTYSPDKAGNNLLFSLLGVEAIDVVSAQADPLARMHELADQMAAQGRKAYVVPVGASTPLGALGYAACALETLAQIQEMRLRFDALVCGSGSGGTHAGLVAGLTAMSAGLPVIGVNVSRPKDAQEALILNIARAAAELAGSHVSPTAKDVECVDNQVGPGYSLPTKAMVEAVELFARTEGILLDPVYTGKAAAGFIELVRNGRFSAGQKVLFLHTGGSPALHAYSEYFRD
jgi:D-cysteine desulfhydrase